MLFSLRKDILNGTITKLNDLTPFNINLTDTSGSSLLHEAVKCCNGKAVVFLCEKGVDVNLANQDGATPIFFALTPEKNILFNYLISKGARLDYILKNDGGSLLHMCAEVGNREALQRILEEKVLSVDVESHGGITPLFTACQRGNFEEAKLLITYGADVKKRNKAGCPPIFVASFKGHDSIVSLLLDHGAIPL